MSQQNTSLTDEMHEGPERHVVDWTTSDSPTSSVLKAVATVTNRSLPDLQPLYDVIDPDALDQVCESGPEASSLRSNTSISFRFEGCDVTVHGDGRTVASLSASRNP